MSAAGSFLSSYFLDDHEIAAELQTAVPALAADLIDLATTVYCADRVTLADRQLGKALRVEVPVRQPDAWTKNVLRRTEDLLASLTDDAWQIRTHRRTHSARSSEVQSWLFGTDPPAEILLFSGGLDSLAGAALALNCVPRGVALVSAASHSAHVHAQRNQAKLLRQAAGVRVRHVVVRHGLPGGNRIRQNRLRRARGFFHLALGCAVAITAGVPYLTLAENGWGALNLDYDGSQVGADMSQAVTPATLLGMSELVSELQRNPFRIENRARTMTKAELLRAASSALPPQAICESFSCDRFPLRRRGQKQCGCCTSCFLRRHALACAGLAGRDRLDYIEPAGRSEALAKLFERGRSAIRAQSGRVLRCSRAADPTRALELLFPSLRSAAEAESRLICRPLGSVQRELAELLIRQAREWTAPAGRPMAAAA